MLSVCCGLDYIAWSEINRRRSS